MIIAIRALQEHVREMRAGLLSLSTIDIWGQITLCFWKTVWTHTYVLKLRYLHANDAHALTSFTIMVSSEQGKNWSVIQKGVFCLTDV